MRLALIGASGLLGRRVLARWLEQGREVRVLCRADSAQALPSASRADAVVGDLFDDGAMSRLVENCDTVANLATALKPLNGVVDWQANDRIRREGTRQLLRACQRAGVQRLVQQSVAFVDSGERLDDGLGPLAPLPHLASASDMEAAVEQSGMQALILRGGLFWGPGTSMQAWMESQGHDQPARGLGNTEADWVSLIHLDDMAHAVAEAATAGLTGRLAIVDGEPLRWRELIAGLAAACGRSPAARPGLGALPSFRVTDSAAVRVLNFQAQRRVRELFGPAGGTGHHREAGPNR